MSKKKRSENKNATNEYRYLIKLNFVGVHASFVLVYSNQDDDSKRFKSQGYYLLKGIIDNYNVTVNVKSFYDQAIDSDIKRCKESGKLTTGQD